MTENKADSTKIITTIRTTTVTRKTVSLQTLCEHFGLPKGTQLYVDSYHETVGPAKEIRFVTETVEETTTEQDSL